jgi:hypothetical protein
VAVLYHTEHSTDQQNYIADGNHVTAYSWKQHAEINLKATTFLLRSEWVVRGVTVCVCVQQKIPQTEITRNGSDCLKIFIGFLELMTI